MPRSNKVRMSGYNRAALVALVIAIVAASTATRSLDPAVAQPADDYTIELSRQTDLLDGELIEVKLTSPPGVSNRGGLMYVCRDGVDYQTIADLRASSGNCPGAAAGEPLSSSGTSMGALWGYRDQTGAFGRLRAGIGTAVWRIPSSPSDPPAFHLTCGPDDPCRLVLQLTVGNRTVIDDSTLLTFAEENALQACSGTDPEALTVTGPDRMLSAWVRWTQSLCRTGSGTSLTRPSLVGEGEGHHEFSEGKVDLTFSATGAGFEPATGERPSASVPVALNAVVFAMIGGHQTDRPDWPNLFPMPYSDVKVTTAEMAALFGGGQLNLEQHREALTARNPQLGNQITLATKSAPMAVSSSDATTWFASRRFTHLAPGDWKTPPVAADDIPPGTRRGVVDAFAFADPAFSQCCLEVFSARANLQKSVQAYQVEIAPNQYGPIWVLTDYATANQFGLQMAAVETTPGHFVQPTPESIAAAVPHMEQREDGVRVPRPDAAAADSYPMAFVEYIVAPTQPLVDDTCTVRTTAQVKLRTWLTHLTGVGQEPANLAHGYLPLTAGLKQEAATALESIGRAPLAGDCAEAEVVPPAGGEETPSMPEANFLDRVLGSIGSRVPSSSSGPSLPGGLGSTLGGSGSVGALSGSGDEVQVQDDDTDSAAELIEISEVALPPFMGVSSFSSILSPLALLVVAGLTALWAGVSSGAVKLPSRKKVTS